jgi:ferredoxin
MIVAKRKPFEEIKEMLKGYKKVLNVGCGTCVSVCLAGGEKEVAILNAELDMARKLEDDPIEIQGQTIERQCDREYLAELDDLIKKEKYRCFDVNGLRCWNPVSGGKISLTFLLFRQ